MHCDRRVLERLHRVQPLLVAGTGLRVIGDYTGGNFVEHELHDERWDGFLQCFDNGERP